MALRSTNRRKELESEEGHATEEVNVLEGQIEKQREVVKHAKGEMERMYLLAERIKGSGKSPDSLLNRAEKLKTRLEDEERILKDKLDSLKSAK